MAPVNPAVRGCCGEVGDGYSPRRFRFASEVSSLWHCAAREEPERSFSDSSDRTAEELDKG